MGVVGGAREVGKPPIAQSIVLGRLGQWPEGGRRVAASRVARRGDLRLYVGGKRRIR